MTLAQERVRETISSDDSLIVFTRPANDCDENQTDLNFREARSGDGPRYARDIGTDSAATFRARISDTTHCFVVTQGDLIVHASWVTTSAAWTREVRSYVVPPAGGAYIYESFTRPEVRGQGVYPLALRKITGWAKIARLESVWVAVEADNPASVRAVQKAGFEEAFRIAYRRRWGRLTIAPPTGQMAHVGANFLKPTT